MYSTHFINQFRLYPEFLSFIALSHLPAILNQKFKLQSILSKMKSRTQIPTQLVILTVLLSLTLCQQAFQIHTLELLPASKPQHLEGNLRTHDRYSSSSDSISGALFGFVLGPILFFTAFACIWFNQKRAVIDHRRLKLAEEISVEVNPLRRDQIQAAHMKLTYISGNSTTNQTLRDPLSNIAMNGAIKMIRSVEVMEWRATVNDRNGTRHIDYNLGWQSSNQSSAQGKSNPAQNWFINTQTIYNQKVFVGEYFLSKSQEDQCQKSNPISLDMNNANAIASNTHRTSRPVVQDGYIYFPSSSGSISDHGALRVKYAYCPVGPITLMAKTVQNSFEPFPIAQYEGNGKIQKNQLPACCCISNCVAELLKPIEQIDLVEEQIMSKSDIIAKAVEKSKLMTWIIRVVSYFMMVLGICLFFSPITAILGFIPLVGGILKGTVGFVIFLAALLVCIPLWIIAFSLAWLFYHPKVGAIFLGIGLLILGILLAVNYSRKGDTQSAAAAAQTVKHMLRTWTN